MSHDMSKLIGNYINNIDDKYGYAENIVVEHRSNNPKRDFLFCNKVQGKHIPVSPDQVEQMVDILAKQVVKVVNPKDIVVVGFAETATCLGNIMAEKLNCTYVMQTTRENCEPYGQILEFSEEHSHATEQKLYGKLHRMNYAKYILFVEDEISTGKTILNFIAEFSKIKPNLKYGVASICNWQTEENREKYAQLGIDTFALIRGEVADINGKMDVGIDKSAISDHSNVNTVYKTTIIRINTKELVSPILEKPVSNFIYERTGHKYNDIYNRIIEINIIRHLKFMPSFKSKKNILVLGTEEFMYIPYRVAKMLSKEHSDVKFHATSRSSIDIMDSTDSEVQGLVSKFKVNSAYDTNRNTYVYNLTKYDGVVVITDSRNREATNKFVDSITSALCSVGNKESNIYIIVLE